VKKVPGINGQGLKFDGVDDTVNIAESSSLRLETTNTLTLSMWIKRSSSSAGGVLFTKGLVAGGCGNYDGYVLSVTSDGKLTYHVNGGSLDTTNTSATAPLANTNWHHIVVIFRIGGNIEGYVDT